jgi:hypothetical protein
MQPVHAQARHYQGQLAEMAVRAVIRCLQAVGRLPENYSLGMPQCHVPSNAHRLIGRHTELEAVLDGLRERRCIVISGGPGEGKTTLAQEAVWRLWEQKALPGGAYAVDLTGDLRNSLLLLSDNDASLGETAYKISAAQ